MAHLSKWSYSIVWTRKKLAHFYGKLLGGKVLADPFGGYTVDTQGIALGFQQDEDYAPPVWPGKKGDQLQMLHVDIKVADMQAANEICAIHRRHHATRTILPT